MLDFWLCFVPLFVAVDALGTLPIFMSLTAGFERARVRRIIWQSLVTAVVVAFTFLGVGKGIFTLLGVTVADFMIAGGTLLFLLSLRGLLLGEREQLSEASESLGVVPLGVPLIAGPAVFTTSLLLVDEYGFIPTTLALLANIAIAGVIFGSAARLMRVLGESGMRALSKIASLILAAIAVMIVRKGIMSYLG
ncbi:MAG: MarC family protein [Candidatus Bipolaricaulota bacterium]|nr:MarC family protein [Candidatus Bipolaricaulota bacterium]MDW8031038.1 MarC family protein [Candidatus Bipolaricaulota bacterium]